MKRRIVSFVLAILLIFTLTSCDLLFKDSTSIIEYSYSDNEYLKIKEKINKADSLVNTTDKYEELFDLYLDINSFIYDVATYSNIEFLKTSLNTSTDTSNYLKFESIVGELTSWQKEFMQKIYKSSYKSKFFEGMTDDEIIEEIGNVYPEEFYNLSYEVEEMLVEYRALSENEVILQASDYYYDIVNKYKRMASLAGYSNYLDYSYENVYGREYSVESISQFKNNVKQYVVPELLEAYDAYNNSTLFLSNKNSMKVREILMESFFDNSSLLDSYARYVGGNYYMIYNQLWNNGYFYFSSNSSALDAAYTTYLYTLDVPVVYFGPRYQDSFTVAHEFGHYYAAMCNNGMGGAYDLSETQSQGNELLFLSYIENNGNYTTAVTDALRSYMLYSTLMTITISTIVNEFECRIYTNSYEKDYYDTLFIEICDEIIGYDTLAELISINPEDYWKMVAIDNAGYYISYAISAVSALELYCNSEESLNDAIDDYISLCTYTELDSSYYQTLANAGLSKPTDYSAFFKISGLFN